MIRELAYQLSTIWRAQAISMLRTRAASKISMSESPSRDITELRTNPRGWMHVMTRRTSLATTPNLHQLQSFKDGDVTVIKSPHHTPAPPSQLHLLAALVIDPNGIMFGRFVDSRPRNKQTDVDVSRATFSLCPTPLLINLYPILVQFYQSHIRYMTVYLRSSMMVFLGSNFKRPR